MKKKILLSLLFLLAVISICLAQEESDDESELVYLQRFIKEGEKIIFAGKIDQENYYLVYQPLGQDCKKYRVKVGKRDELKDLEVNYNDVLCQPGASTFIFTEKGLLYFPREFLRQGSRPTRTTFRGESVAKEFVIPSD